MAVGQMLACHSSLDGYLMGRDGDARRHHSHDAKTNYPGKGSVTIAQEDGCSR